MLNCHLNSIGTAILDKHGRKWCYRTFKSSTINNLMASFTEAAKNLVDTVEANKTGFSEALLNANSRGPHWASIMGYDRNNKKVCHNSMSEYPATHTVNQTPALTAWHKNNKEAVDQFFANNSPAIKIRYALSIHMKQSMVIPNF